METRHPRESRRCWAQRDDLRSHSGLSSSRAGCSGGVLGSTSLAQVRARGQNRCVVHGLQLTEDIAPRLIHVIMLVGLVELVTNCSHNGRPILPIGITSSTRQVTGHQSEATTANDTVSLPQNDASTSSESDATSNSSTGDISNELELRPGDPNSDGHDHHRRRSTTTARYPRLGRGLRG